MKKLQLLLWYWDNPQAKHKGKFEYTPDHVHKTARGFKRVCPNLNVRVNVITDQPELFQNTEYNVVRLWEDIPKYRCYPRLKIFKWGFFEYIGASSEDFLLSLDLDCVFLDSRGVLEDEISDAWKSYKFLGWFDSVNTSTWSGAFMGFPAQNRLHRVWDALRCIESFDESRFTHPGSDQGFFNTVIGGGLFSDQVAEMNNVCSGAVMDVRELYRYTLYPEVVMMNGMDYDPSLPEMQEKYPWIKEYWV